MAFIDLTNHSISESCYIINSYIEEAVSDLSVKVYMVDNKCFTETGKMYFTKAEEDGKNKLLDKIKGIFTTVWGAIAGVFDKVKNFFKDLIANIKIKKFNEKDKKIIMNFPDAKFKELVYDIEKYYDLNAAKINIDAMVGNLDDVKAGKYQHIKLDTDKIIVKGAKLTELITKAHIADVAFGGFREEYKQTSQKFDEVKKAFKTIQDKSNKAVNVITSESDDSANYFTTVKNALKDLNKYATSVTTFIIYDANVITGLVKKILKMKDFTTDEVV